MLLNLSTLFSLSFAHPYGTVPRVAFSATMLLSLVGVLSIFSARVLSGAGAEKTLSDSLDDGLRGKTLLFVVGMSFSGTTALEVRARGGGLCALVCRCF